MPHILIIDDSQEDCKTYQRFLKKAFSSDDVNLDFTDNLKDGMSLIKNKPIDCVLLDYHLPTANGIQVLDKLTSEVDSPPPVIMLTGQGNEKVAVNAIKLGAFDYLIKDEITSVMLHSTIMSAIASAIDRQENKQKEEQIFFMAHHDVLTKLLNRFSFDTLIEKNIARAKRNKEILGLLMIDLDYFKEVNDRYGHQAGDFVLVEVAKRLGSEIRTSDTLARIGGDEFILAVNDLKKNEDIRTVAEKILISIREPIIFEGKSINISVSIGGVSFPKDGDDLITLKKSADMALYRAKDQGRDRYEIFI